MSRTMLNIENAASGYGQHRVLKDVSFTVEEGDFIALIGSNGTGKSTLIKTIAGLIPLDGGKIEICGKDQARLKTKERARMVAVVPQSYYVDYDFLVEDIVMMGRNPYGSFRKRNYKEDEEIVEKAMAMTNTDVFRGKSYNQLSGGERQRVIIARAIAQQPDIILMDEPTSALDTHYATEVMELITKLNREQNVTIMAVLHDINMAARYCKRMVMLREGYVYADGTPEEIVNHKYMTELYQMQLMIRHNALFNKPEMIPIRVLDPVKTDKPKHIHVICGGNTASMLLEDMASQGHKVTAGVVSPLSDDGSMCRNLGIETIEMPPFGEVTEELQVQNLALAREADLIIVADMPFGKGNIRVLDGLENLKGDIQINEALDPIGQDYTGEGLLEKRINIIKAKKN